MPAAVEEAISNNNAESSSNENNENEEKPDRHEQMWKVLKAYILRDRARKKQEREAEVEEERLRKEREAREQQDVMTLGETREQISQLEAKLQQFKDEKHQLFLQLKKVLNEDDNRRRKLQKDANEQQMVQLQSFQQQMVPHQPPALYIQQPQTPGRIQTMSQQAPPQMPPAAYKTTVKRPRSPSPPPQVPVSLYHQGYNAYKPPNLPTGSYQGSPQKDDGRRNELVRAVLWNKAPQYSSQPSAFYPVHQDISIYYSGLSRDAGRPMYDQQRPQGFPIDHKLSEHYTALRTATSQHGHVIQPGPGLALNPAQAPPKAGGITTGYPVRTQPQYQQPSPAPASLYTTQARQLYQNYPPRD